MSSYSDPAIDEERLIHIKEVTQHYAVCGAFLENLQSAHYSLLKAKQQARQLCSGQSSYEFVSWDDDIPN